MEEPLLGRGGWFAYRPLGAAPDPVGDVEPRDPDGTPVDLCLKEPPDIVEVPLWYGAAAVEADGFPIVGPLCDDRGDLLALGASMTLAEDLTRWAEAREADGPSEASDREGTALAERLTTAFAGRYAVTFGR